MNKQRRDRISTIKESLAGLKSELETLQEEEQEAYDAMPEGLQRTGREGRRLSRGPERSRLATRMRHRAA